MEAIKVKTKSLQGILLENVVKNISQTALSQQRQAFWTAFRPVCDSCI